MQRERTLDEMVARLAGALGERLVSVVLYGPAAHGDDYRAVRQLHLLIVTADLGPETLAQLGDPIRWWLKSGEAWPRLFTRELLRDSLDIYPIELLDITRHHRVLHGQDPLAEITPAAPELLRLQCERELREKLMRLREGYVETRARPKALRELLAASYTSFALVWRGCLHLLGAEVPLHDREVAAALAARLDLDPRPFEEVADIAEGRGATDEPAVFARYYAGLERMVARIDRWVSNHKET